MTNPLHTHISVVLDRSGSMEAVRNDTIGGFNAFLEEQRKQPGKCTISMAQFDGSQYPIYENRPASEAPMLTRATYIPSGSTALLDAIGINIDKLGVQLAALPAAERPGKVLFVILTDGEENASREYTHEAVFAKIAHQREKYGWDFVFLGANQDAIKSGASLGISAGKSMSYVANAAGTQHAFRSMSSYTLRARTADVSEVASNTFTEEDREAQEVAGAQP